MVHLHGLHFRGDSSRRESNDHTCLNDLKGTLDALYREEKVRFYPCFHTAYGHRPNTANLVDVLKGETKRLIGRARGRVDIVDSVLYCVKPVGQESKKLIIPKAFCQ